MSSWSTCGTRAAVAVAVLAVAVFAFLRFSPLATQIFQVSNGYGAKLSCSAVFVAQRTQASIEAAELEFPPIIYMSRFEVDEASRCVTGISRLNPSLRQRACFRSRHLGCVLMHDNPEAVRPEHPLWSPPVTTSPLHATDLNGRSLPWPWGDASASASASALDGVDLARIDQLVSAHFADTRLHTRAFLLVRDGELIYERYGDGAGPSTPLIGWSMTKSITATLVGLRQQQTGAFGIDTPFRLREWPTANLTVGQMLQMSDGLDFDEVCNACLRVCLSAVHVCALCVYV